MDWAKQAQAGKTIIAFFGDHLPPLGPVYVETGFMKEPVASRKAPLAEMAARARDAAGHLVEPRRPGPKMSARSARPSSRMHPDAHRRHHATLITPASSARCTTAIRVVDRNMLIARRQRGVCRIGRKQRELDPVIRDFRYLEYDMMFGKRFGTPGFFPEIGQQRAS